MMSLIDVGENAVQFFNCTLHRVVYDDVIEFILLGKLALRRFQTLLHLRPGAASAQTIFHPSSSNDGGAMNTITASDAFHAPASRYHLDLEG